MKFLCRVVLLGQAWWCAPIIPALEMLRDRVLGQSPPLKWQSSVTTITLLKVPPVSSYTFLYELTALALQLCPLQSTCDWLPVELPFLMGLHAAKNLFLKTPHRFILLIWLVSIDFSSPDWRQEWIFVWPIITFIHHPKIYSLYWLLANMTSLDTWNRTIWRNN